MNSEQRDKTIVKVSVMAIAANIMLAAFKAGAGYLSHSIAMILDAVNNLSDALSSVITIIGTKLAMRRPDKKHPLGHGRIEYITAMIVSFIVLYAGISAGIESVKKIFAPVKPDYTSMALVIMAVAILVKLILGKFVTMKGTETNSQALVASGKDAFFDAVLSLSVLVTALIYIYTGVSLEAYVGVLIAVIIIKSGGEILLDTLSDILGRRADPALTKKIKKIISEEPEVRGAYDLVLNNYGPDKNIGSVHIELPEDMTVKEMDVLTRRLEDKVMEETGVFLTGVGVYSYNTNDEEAIKIREDVLRIVMKHEHALQMHGFYTDTEKKDMRFDVVFDFDADTDEIIEKIKEEIDSAHPGYTIKIFADKDITDI